MCLSLSKAFGSFLSGFPVKFLGCLTGLSRVFSAYSVWVYELLDYKIWVCSVVLQGIPGWSSVFVEIVCLGFWECLVEILGSLSPEGRCVAYSVGVQLFPLFRPGNVLHFQNHPTTVTFFPLDNVLSSEGRCVAYPVGVQLIFLLILSVLRNVRWRKRRSP